jgi:hypothetical protein
VRGRQQAREQEKRGERQSGCESMRREKRNRAKEQEKREE